MITNMEVRVLADHTIYYRFTNGGGWFDGSFSNWSEFSRWLAEQVGVNIERS